MNRKYLSLFLSFMVAIPLMIESAEQAMAGQPGWRESFQRMMPRAGWKDSTTPMIIVEDTLSGEEVGFVPDEVVSFALGHNGPWVTTRDGRVFTVMNGRWHDVSEIFPRNVAGAALTPPRKFKFVASRGYGDISALAKDGKVYYWSNQ